MTSARLLLPLLFALVGCDELGNCPDGLDPRIVPHDTKGSPAKTDLETLTYESAPWSGPLQAFPPDTDMHFIHDLGHIPTLVKTYLAFSEDGTSKGDVTENAGNQGRIQCVDAHEIVITNDTCEEDFHIRVVAWSTGNEKTDVFCSPSAEPDGAAGATSGG